MKPLEPPNKNLFLGYDGSLTMGILPVSIFCSGHTMYVQRMAQRLKLEPYAVHGTFQFSGTPGKRHRMREFMLYDDPPEYYDHPVGFVSFDVSVAGCCAVVAGRGGALTGTGQGRRCTRRTPNPTLFSPRRRCSRAPTFQHHLI